MLQECINKLEAGESDFESVKIQSEAFGPLQLDLDTEAKKMIRQIKAEAYSDNPIKRFFQRYMLGRKLSKVALEEMKATLSALSSSSGVVFDSDGQNASKRDETNANSQSNLMSNETEDLRL